ncbi:MAG: FtsX-like permease family protein [Tessaracoccus sp.]
MSALSIVLGVAFIAGSLMFTRLLSSGFDEIIKGALADVNVTVAGRTIVSVQPPGRADLLEPNLVDEVAALDGVEAAVGLVNGNQVFVVDVDGHLAAFPAPRASCLTGTTFLLGGWRAPASSRVKRLPTTARIMIDPSTARRAGYAVGDEVAISTPFDGIQRYRLVGTATYGAGATAGASYVFLTTAEAQRLLTDGADAYHGMWVRTADGAEPQAVAEQVGEVAPEPFRSRTGDQVATEIEDQLDVGLGFVNVFLLIFAGVAVLVATLLILNTSILVAQRARELALFRALGAKRGQVRQIVLFEAVVVGVVGAVIGVFVGYGLAWAILAGMRSFNIDLGTASPQLTWQVAAISMAVGIVMSLLAALPPVRRASRARPVEAMASMATGGPEKLGAVGVTGIVLIEVGVAVLVCGVFLDVTAPLWWVGAGGALLLIGLVLAATLIGAPVLMLFRWMFSRMFGEPGRLAGLNARRQPRRTAATAATLMIGLAMVTAVAVLAASTTTSIREQLTADQSGDFLLSPIGYQPFDATVIEEAEAIDGVVAVHGFFEGDGTLDGDPIRLGGVTPNALVDGAVVRGMTGVLGEEPDAAMISADIAREHDLALGMLFNVAGPLGEHRVLVTAIYTDPDATFGDVVLNRATFAELAEDSLVHSVVIDTFRDADQAQVHDGLREVVAELPTVVVADVEEFIAERVGQFSPVFSLLYALLALAIVISVLGIVNTLGLSVIERTREIGLLRAIGLTRQQLRRMITLESVTVAVLGSVLGVLLGVIFGVAVVSLLRESGIQHLHIPWVQLVAFVVVAAVFGWLAALIPARRASRLQVLDAIARQ